MSSDVYLYILREKDPAEYIERIPIGHLAVFRYFGYNLLDKLRNLLRAQPITENSIRRIEIAVLHAHAAIKIDSSLSPEDFANCYGYVGPEGIEWDLIPEPGEMTEDLTKYIGKYASISCD